MYNSKFTTERTAVRPIQESDIECLLRMYQEPESCRFIPPLLDKNDEEYREILLGKIKSNQDNGVGFWTVWDKVTGDLIGTLNLYYSDQFKVEHIGLHLSRNYWSKGFGTELMTALIQYGFKVRDLSAIHAIINHDHVVSQRLFSKLGFLLKEKVKEEDGEAWVYVKNR